MGQKETTNIMKAISTIDKKWKLYAPKKVCYLVTFWDCFFLTVIVKYIRCFCRKINKNLQNIQENIGSIGNKVTRLFSSMHNSFCYDHRQSLLVSQDISAWLDGFGFWSYSFYQSNPMRNQFASIKIERGEK